MRWLEKLVNLAIVAACAAVVYSVVSDRLQSSERSQPTMLKKGDTLSSFDRTELQQSERSLVMVLRSTCKYCDASIPFYQRLSEHIRSMAEPSRIRMIVLSDEQKEITTSYLQARGLKIDSVISMTQESLRAMKVLGTPTLILVDRNGTVANAWFGRLMPAAEREIEVSLGMPTGKP